MTTNSLDQPLVSIVTPSYNQGIFIERTINSVLSQDYQNIEYWVIDGGSSDNTIDILEKYNDSRFHWLSEKDDGQTNAINKGLKLTNGQIQAFLNSDDLYLPKTISKVVNFLQENSTIDMVYGKCEFTDKDDNIIGTFGESQGSINPNKNNFKRMVYQGDSFPQPTTFWRRSVTEKTGLFNESLNYTMDYDFFLRVSKDFNISYIDSVLAYYRLHADSKTVSQEKLHWQEAMNVSLQYGLRKTDLWYWKRKIRHEVFRILPLPLQNHVKTLLGRKVMVN